MHKISALFVDFKYLKIRYLNCFLSAKLKPNLSIMQEKLSAFVSCIFNFSMKTTMQDTCKKRFYHAVSNIDKLLKTSFIDVILQTLGLLYPHSKHTLTGMQEPNSLCKVWKLIKIPFNCQIANPFNEM